jgi:hypothetical protein
MPAMQLLLLAKDEKLIRLPAVLATVLENRHIFSFHMSFKSFWLRHNIALWLDEEGKANRTMPGKRLNKVTKVYRIRNGIANILSCLSPKSGGRPCLGKSGVI